MDYTLIFKLFCITNRGREGDLPSHLRDQGTIIAPIHAAHAEIRGNNSAHFCVCYAGVTRGEAVCAVLNARVKSHTFVENPWTGGESRLFILAVGHPVRSIRSAAHGLPVYFVQRNEQILSRKKGFVHRFEAFYVYRWNQHVEKV